MPEIESKQSVASLQRLSYLLVIFFCYVSVSPAIRVFLVGANAMSNLYEAAITVVPDLLFAIIFVLSLLFYVKNEKFKLTLFDRIVLFYFFFNLVYGTIISGTPSVAMRGFRLTYFPVIFYFIGRLYFREKTGMSSKTTNFLFLGLLTQGVLAIVFYFMGFETYFLKITHNVQLSYFIPRMGGFILTPVCFGTLMSLTGGYFFYRLLSGKSAWNYLFIALCWTCVFLSVSRGPIMAFFIGFILLTIIFKAWKKALIALVIIFAASAIWSYILTGSFNIIGWLFSSTVDTIGLGEGITRVELWRRSWHSFLQRPYGFGLGHAGAMANRFFKGTTVPAAVYTTDGWFLKLACETGIPGLLSYFTLCFYYLALAKRNLAKQMNTLVPFVFVLFLMVNAICVVSNTFDFYPVIGLVWLLMGYSINIIEQQ